MTSPYSRWGRTKSLYNSVKVCLGKYLERYFSKPMPFLVLEVADLICAEKESFESSTVPRCLCSCTFCTGISLNYITG